MPFINKPPKKKRINRSDKRRYIHRLYCSSEWQQLRLLKLQENPICEICGRKLAEEVHHKDSIWKYNDEDSMRVAALYVDLDGLMSLCKDCHVNLHKELNNNKLKV